jgi:hypothetical protein
MVCAKPMTIFRAHRSCSSTCPTAPSMTAVMDTPMDDDEREDLIRRLFALITSKFEDGAAIAADGQMKAASDSYRTGIAERTRIVADELSILCRTAQLICHD